MNTSILVLLFWAERGDRQFEPKKDKRSAFVDNPDESDEEEKQRAVKRVTRGTALRSGGATAKGACRSAAAPDEAAWVNPSLADATGLEDVNTGRLVEFMFEDCDWYLTNGKRKVQLLRNERVKKNQDAVWTWFGDGEDEYCYRSTPDIKDVPGFQVPAFSEALTGEGWQLMHEVKANPADPVLAQKVRAGKTWVNYGLFPLEDLEALMQRSSDLGRLMSRNKGTEHTFCDKGIYKVYVGPQEVLRTSARWTHNYKTSKLLGTITMHTGKEKSDAIVCSDADGSFSNITVTASRAAYKGVPGGVVFDPKTSAVYPLLRNSAIALTFDLGSFEKSRIVRAADECIVCYTNHPYKIPAGLPPLARCGHQDVCEPCLLQLQKNRSGQSKCPSCREEYGGPTFELIKKIAAKKKDAQDKVDRARTKIKQAEADLMQAETEKDAMYKVSAANIMQIMSVFSVPQKMAEEALNAKNHDLQLASELVMTKKEEEVKLEQGLLEVNMKSPNRFVSPIVLWDIIFEMKEYTNKDDKVGKILAWTSRDLTSVTFKCPVDGSHVKGTIMNNSKTNHLWYTPVYRGVSGFEEPEREYDLKTGEDCELPFPIAKYPKELPDAWLLKDGAGSTILTLKFTV